jgi:hypothetical protein
MSTSTSSAWDEIEKQLDQVKKPVGVFKLCRDPEVRERYLNARQADEQARQQIGTLPAKGGDREVRALLNKEAADAAAELAAAQAEYDAQTVVLRFTALDRNDLTQLMKAHPPTEEDEERGDEWAMDTFAPALISTASLDGMPLEAAQRYFSTWPPSDSADLFRAAWFIQHQKRTDLGKG